MRGARAVLRGGREQATLRPQHSGSCRFRSSGSRPLDPEATAPAVGCLIARGPARRRSSPAQVRDHPAAPTRPSAPHQRSCSLAIAARRASRGRLAPPNAHTLAFGVCSRVPTPRAPKAAGAPPCRPRPHRTSEAGSRGSRREEARGMHRSSDPSRSVVAGVADERALRGSAAEGRSRNDGELRPSQESHHDGVSRCAGTIEVVEDQRVDLRNSTLTPT